MGIVDLIGKVINDVGTSVVLREHLALIKEKAILLEEKVKHLEKENTELANQINTLNKQILKYAKSEQFVPHRGALFKKKPGGGYIEAAYCPNCEIATGSLDRSMSFDCKCGWTSKFNSGELDVILKELEALSENS